MKKSSAAALFAAEHARRLRTLDEIREVANTIDATILPPEDWDEDDALPQSCQSDASYFCGALVGKVLSAAFPPGAPWVASEVMPEDRAGADESLLSRVEQALWFRDMQIVSAIESASGEGGNDSVAGFHSRARSIIEQVVVTGDALVRMDADLGLTLFRRDHYTVRRDGRGDVLSYTTREAVDAASLFGRKSGDDAIEPSAVLSAFNLKTPKGLASRPINERTASLFTRVEWQPLSRRWHLRQEIGVSGSSEAVEIAEWDEKVASHWSVTWKVPTRMNYGIGLGYLLRGNLTSYDELSLRMLEFAEAASKHHWIVSDTAANFDEKRLMMRSGTISRGNVVNGQAQDIACVRIDKMGDFSVAKAHHTELRSSLAKAFLADSGSVRDAERTTAFEVARVTIAELQNALGAVYANIVDGFQRPLYARAQAQMIKGLQLIPIPERGARLRQRSLTGLAALAKQAKFTSLAQFREFAAGLGESALARVNDGKILEVAARYFGIWEPGVIYTEEEMEARIQRAMQRQAMEQAQTAVIETAAAAAQSRATQQQGA